MTVKADGTIGATGDAAAAGAGAAGGTTTGQQAAGATWTPPTREEHEKSTKELAETRKALEETRKEAADRRVKAKEADDAKVATEKAAAEAKGEWSKVVELERAATKKVADDYAAAQKRLAELEPYEGTVKQRVEGLIKALGDKVPPGVDKLPASQAMPILEHIQAMTAGAGRAQQTTQGKPAPVVVDTKLDDMTPEERTKYLRTLSREERQQLLNERTGASTTANPFARVIAK